jgi:hypothetical protein
VSIDSNIKHREILRRPCPVHSTNFRVVGQKLYGENHRIALVRTAREERANCVQYSPCIAISLIGECRLFAEVRTTDGLRLIPVDQLPQSCPAIAILSMIDQSFSIRVPTNW